MSTSERAVFLEAAASAAIVGGLLALLAPDELGRPDGLHPAWVLVAVFAARYAVRGLLLALASNLAVIAAACFALHGSFDGLVARLDRSADLLALVACTLVAWVAMSHEGGRARLTSGLQAATAQREVDQANLAVMEGLLTTLRARLDRIDLSIGMWREIARQLEHGTPAVAASAALELGVIRLGASAGIVQIWDGVHLATLARRGDWPRDDPRPRDISPDRTAIAAIARRRPVLAVEVEGVSPEDSDVAVPIFAGRAGPPVGILALRGVPCGRLRAVEVSELVLIADWLGEVFPRAEPAKVLNQGAAS